MALYHFSAKVYSRAKGQSACGAAAYRSGERIECEYDGTTYDYRRKQNVEYSVVLLPENAPEEYMDRSFLWNSVENYEKQSNARLCREIEFALPRELPSDIRQQMALEFIQEKFVNDGMCADVCFHNPPKMNSQRKPINIHGKETSNPEEYIYNNPHVHCLLTMRTLDLDGQWETKKQKMYICEKDGLQKQFSATELKHAEDGWEKLYYYKNQDGKKSWHTKTYVVTHPEEGLTQVNRYPKCEQIINPKVAKWDDAETLLKWREEWAKKMNLYYKMYGIEENVSHLSYEEQGLDIIPTVHEGKSITIEEKRLKEEYERKISQGIPSVEEHTEVRKLNMAIREHNQGILLEMDLKKLQIKMQEFIKPVVERINKLQLSVAEQLEYLRHDIIDLGIKIRKAIFLKSDCDEKLNSNKAYLKDLTVGTNIDIEGIKNKIDMLKSELENSRIKANKRMEIEKQIQILEQSYHVREENMEIATKVTATVESLKEQSQALTDNIESMQKLKTDKKIKYDELSNSINVDDEKIKQERLTIRASLEKDVTHEFKREAIKFDGADEGITFGGMKFH